LEVALRKFVAALFTVAISTIGASAADLPVRTYTKAPAAVAPVYNWTGFYIGGTAGGAWTKADVGLDTVNGAPALYRPGDIPALNALGSPSLSGSKAIFGGKIGFNKQWNSYVAGLEGDFSSFRFNKSASATGNPFTSPPAFAFGSAEFNTNVSTNWLATVRARAGYAVDRVFFYATAGAAFAKVDFSNTYHAFSPGGRGFDDEATSASKTKVGWVAGGGIDYALTTNWIVSAEYLHVDLGSIETSGLATTGGAANATFNFSTKLKSDIVRGGIAYKF
jgi:outer membrane immunogenic protein